MILEKRIPIGYWIKLVIWDLLTVGLFSTLIYIITIYLPELDIPIAIGTFLGTAIALLLSFKLSQSYDRWWEARKIWGAIVNDSRTLVMQVKNFTSAESKAAIKTIAYRQIAWCYSLGQSLRKKDPLEHTNTFITEGELAGLVDQVNIPVAILDHQSRDISKLHINKQINDYQQIQIDNTILRLASSMGGAERIKNTAFPKTYRLTLHIFIYIFLILLSFSITESRNLLDIPLLMLISFPFFLLEKISQKMQDPFENRPSDTAMTNIAMTIEINLKQLIEDEEIPSSPVPDKFYTL